MNNKKITGVSDGTLPKHAINKQQLDNLMKLYYYSTNITFKNKQVVFSKNNSNLNISQGIYLISYHLPINISSDYNSKGTIQLITRSIINRANILYYYNIPKNTPGHLTNTHIYLIDNSGLLKIQLNGSGVDFNTRSRYIKYIIIYKLFDNLT